jgi:hypothetical protein
MPRRQYVTVPTELTEHADVAHAHFTAMGYKVQLEPFVAEHPYRATFMCKRQHTTTIVEVLGRVRKEAAQTWAAFGRSHTKDTRIALVLPGNIDVTLPLQELLRSLGVGLYRSSGTELFEVIAPKDLCIQVQLPPPATLPKKLRAELGSVYELFERSQWREGFEEACQVVESQARSYLNDGMRSGRIRFANVKGQPVPYTEVQIGKQTLGKLGETFGLIVRQNQADAQVGKALLAINKDRVGVAHKKKQPATETRLRKNVGQHMYTVIAALRLLLGLP